MEAGMGKGEGKGKGKGKGKDKHCWEPVRKDDPACAAVLLAAGGGEGSPCTYSTTADIRAIMAYSLTYIHIHVQPQRQRRFASNVFLEEEKLVACATVVRPSALDTTYWVSCACATVVRPSALDTLYPIV